MKKIDRVSPHRHQFVLSERAPADSSLTKWSFESATSTGSDGKLAADPSGIFIWVSFVPFPLHGSSRSVQLMVTQTHFGRRRVVLPGWDFYLGLPAASSVEPLYESGPQRDCLTDPRSYSERLPHLARTAFASVGPIRPESSLYPDWASRDKNVREGNYPNARSRSTPRIVTVVETCRPRNRG